jgi:hypothetical protein
LVCSKLGVVRLCHARGVRWFGHKTSPTRRLDEIWMTLQASLTALAGWSNIVRRGASKQWTCGVIAKLASRLSRLVVDVSPSNGELTKLPKLPLEGVYLLFKV